MSNKFSYLGSTMHSNVSREDEISIRLGKASTTDRVWKNTHLTTKTKAIRVSYHLVLNAGPHRDTSDASDLSLESHGRIRWQMKNCSESQTLVTLFKTEADNTPLSRTCQQDAKTSHSTHYTAQRLQRRTRSVGRPKLRFKDVLKRGLVIWI